MTRLADIRKEYKMRTLLETDMERNPFLQFTKWWDEVLNSEIDEPNAMTLATVISTGIPSARIVLLKEFSENGFVFFTNYDSHKGKELEQNPMACLVFFWKELERQVRVTGSVEKIAANESDEYFASRPRGSRIGAWASPQSQPIVGRNIIEEKLIYFQQKFEEREIPRPGHWGGYIVNPLLVEFWQGRPNRLHDRIQYTLPDKGEWKIERLAP